jgi:hypothetical protein
MSSLSVTNQMSLTLESLKASAMFFRRGQSLLNLLIKYMKVSCLAMTQTHTHIVFSTSTLVVLKPHVEQYDLDIIDDDEAPYEALQRMAIGEVRPQDPSETASPNDTTPPTQGLDQNEYEDKDEHQDQV